MGKELEENIKQREKKLKDFLVLSKELGLSEEHSKKVIDAMLEDPSKLYKQRN
ncbi:MAG: hypothetical protein LUC88_03410 [Prevotella sp.]|nr:hypothetical protein [Prevotella sp.]